MTHNINHSNSDYGNVNNQESISHINTFDNNKLKSNYKSKQNFVCDYCKKDNHGTAYCSQLLREYTMKQENAVKFWNDNEMDEKLAASNKNYG